MIPPKSFHFLSMIAGLVGLTVLGVSLISPSKALAAVQSFYVLDNTVKQGMLVSLTPNTSVIQPATLKNASQVTGIVSRDELDLNQKSGQIAVKIGGVANGIVSTLNGDIKDGDRITVSALAGVGAKSGATGWIIGTAQGSLNKGTKGAVQSTVTDSNGKKRTVYVAAIPLMVKVSFFSAAKPSAMQDTTWIPKAIQKIADTLAGKHVSALALLISFILFLVGLVLAGLIISSAIRGSIIAIGRQPLAKTVISHLFWKSVGGAVLILISALVISTLILKF